jgi:hypothetical protein
MRVAFTSLAGLGQTEFLSDRQLTLKKVGEGRYELVQAAPPGTERGHPWRWTGVDGGFDEGISR